MEEWRTSIIYYSCSSLTFILLDCGLILKSDWNSVHLWNCQHWLKEFQDAKAFNYVPTLITDSKTWILISSGFKVCPFLNHFLTFLPLFLKKYFCWENFVGVIIFHSIEIGGQVKFCKVWHSISFRKHTSLHTSSTSESFMVLLFESSEES